MTNTFILDMGQSNALGFGNTDPAPYVPTVRVQIWVPDDVTPGGGQWKYMQPGVNTGNAHNPTDWGMEVGQANAFLAADHNPNDYLWIYKYAIGSDPLDAAGLQLDGRTWSPEVAGQTYDAALAGARQAQAVLEPTQYAFSHWDAFVWMQGETDATDAGMASRYGANLADLVQHVRADFGVYDTIIPRIDDGPG